MQTFEYDDKNGKNGITDQQYFQWVSLPVQRKHEWGLMLPSERTLS